MDIKAFLAAFSAGKANAPVGGGAELNIAYGDTPPEDTTKLWVKTAEKPTSVVVSADHAKAMGEVGEADTVKVGTVSSYTYWCQSLVIGNDIYTFGGGAPTRNIYAFNTETNKQTQRISNIPSAIAEAGAAAIGTNVYLFGGRKTGAGLDVIYLYDAEANSIVALDRTLPRKLVSITAEAFGNEIYLLGGYDWGNNQFPAEKVYQYIPESDYFEQCATMPYGRCEMGSVVYNGKVYLFGGRYRHFKDDGTVNNYAADDAIWCFDPVTKEFDIIQERLPIPAVFISCALLGDDVYLLGGKDAGGNSLDTIMVFNMVTKKITILKNKLKVPQQGGACEAVNGAIYLLGGRYTATTGDTNAYTVTPFRTVLQNKAMQILPSADTNLFPFINTDSVRAELGVSKIYKGNDEDRGDVMEAALYKDGEWVSI